MTLTGSQSTARGPVGGRSTPRAGSRGGNVRSVEEATRLQEAHKPTSSERAYAAICAALLQHGRYHRNLLPDLDLPPGDLNCIGSQVSVIKRQGYMVKVGEERNRTAASNARWSPVYEITQAGREKLVGVSAGVPSPQGTEGSSRAPLSASTDPGEQSATRVSAGAPSPKGPDGATNKPDSNRCASVDSGEGSPEVLTGASGEPARLPGSTPPSAYDPWSEAA